MLERTSIIHLNNIIEKNPKWKILDIGCGYRAHPKASTIADVQDFSNFYRGKNFVQILGKNLPFDDKEFDFVIASHVLEHVEDLEFFIKEIERISAKGYIELPSRLGDNLVFENKNDQIEPFITVSTAKLFEKIFRESFVIELAWEEKINYKIDNLIRQENAERISFFKLFRKYLSKKIRTFYK